MLLHRGKRGGVGDVSAALYGSLPLTCFQRVWQVFLNPRLVVISKDPSSGVGSHIGENIEARVERRAWGRTRIAFDVRFVLGYLDYDFVVPAYRCP